MHRLETESLRKLLFPQCALGPELPLFQKDFCVLKPFMCALLYIY